VPELARVRKCRMPKKLLGTNTARDSRIRAIQNFIVKYQDHPFEYQISPSHYQNTFLHPMSIQNLLC
jgi:hypothetical protein